MKKRELKNLRDGMSPEDRIGAWLSAALEDPMVCDEMKQDIKDWFDQTNDRIVRATDFECPRCGHCCHVEEKHMSREAMQLALGMLNEIADDVYCDQKLEGVITALRQALVDADDTLQKRVDEKEKREHEWVGLTADEIWKCNKAKSGSAVEFHICYAHQNVEDFAESIEAKLREKNGG